MKNNNDGDSRLVYSTDNVNKCPSCNKEMRKCSCKKKGASNVKNDGVVRIMKQTKGKKGAGVSVITGLALDGAELKKLAKDLKKKCGTGGTIKDGMIEIQGDKRDLLKAELEKMGIKAKLAGG